jgi:phage terminase small subunit
LSATRTGRGCIGCAPKKAGDACYNIKMGKKKRLTGKEQAFVDYYFVCNFNGTQAAKKAGYSEKTATSIAYENLRKPHIMEAISARLAEVHMGADEALALLATHARGDIGDFMEITSMGHRISLQKAQELGLTKLIKKVDQTTITTNSKNGEDKEIFTEKLELHDPQAALVNILKLHGKFIQKVDLTSSGKEIRVTVAKEE